MNSLFSVSKDKDHIIFRILFLKLSFKRKIKLAAIMCVRNEEYYLPTFLEHIQPYVDFIVAVDDGSTDKTYEILKSHKLCKKVLKLQNHGNEDWNEADNRKIVIDLAKKYGADWVLCCDPDERFELNFLKKIREIIYKDKKQTCYHVHFRECWGKYDIYRTDGIWAKKEKGILFPLMDKMDFNYHQNHHIPWFPKEICNHKHLKYNLYHLKMIKDSEREKRKNLYNNIDPNHLMQKIGYDYLTDEKGIKLVKMPSEKAYDITLLPDDLKTYEEAVTLFQKKKRILFTVWYADGYHGAVIHISEIAEYLISKGWEVHCVCMVLSNDIENYFKSKGIEIKTIYGCNYNLVYDFIWNIHFPLLPFLIKNNIKYKKLIFNSLSAFLEIESPPVFYEAYPLLLAVSEETKERMVNYYNIPDEKIKVLKNVVPLSYFSQKKVYNETIKKVIIVSNHVPQELSECVDLFKEKGIECDILGKKHKYVPMCPEVLLQYDVIITIGKTVQYSLALGIPCYNYDHFGGSGYINEDNLEVEEYYNFSGRSHRTKKTSAEIVSEIIEGYSNILKDSEKMIEIAKNRYCISSQIDSIFDFIMSAPDSEIDLNKYSIVIDQYYFLVNSVRNFKPPMS